MIAWKAVAIAWPAAYLLGSLPFAYWITRWRSGIDVRTVGSGHAGATNTMRAAGWGAGIAVMALDIGKGWLAVWLALRLGAGALGVAAAGALVVIGHCWSAFTGWRGGMGMASAGGALLAVWPLGFVLAVGLDAALQLIIRHSARGNIGTAILIVPLWALFRAPWPDLALALAVAIVVGLRARRDWSRLYRELWFDRE